MENLSPNQTLSSMKRNFYSLSRDVRGIESRVLRLEEEDQRQRKRLQNLKCKNLNFLEVRTQKSQREAELRRSSEEKLQQLALHRERNQLERSHHSKLLSEFKQSISQQRRANFRELRQEHDRNEEAIRRTKESFMRVNRDVRDRVVDRERQSRDRLKQYWEHREATKKHIAQREIADYQHKIRKLQDVSYELEQREKQLVGTLQATQSMAKDEKNQFLTMTVGGGMLPR